jgi:hypothetical protein
LAEQSAIKRASRWLAPSVAAAATGALAAGLHDGLPGGPSAAAIGLAALIAFVPLFVLSAAVRGVVATWRPAELAASLVEDGGGMPRLAGWLATLWLGAAALSWATFTGTWQLAQMTAFKPLAVGFAQPVFAIVAVGLLAAASWPAARLFAALARRIDARWRRWGRRTLLTPRIMITVAALAGVGAACAVWTFAVKPRFGRLDTSLVVGPLVALGATGAAHVVGGRGAVRRIAAIAIVVACAGLIAFAAIGTRLRPGATLDVWGRRPLATLALDTVFDIHAIRSRMPLAAVRPIAQPNARHPDIVLVTFDAVRADHTPPYGGPADMPVLRDLATRGAVFESAFSPSNHTRRSLPALVTGTAANRLRGTVDGPALQLDPRHVVLAERLRAAGYDTAGFVCCEALWTRTGLERGLAHLVTDPSGLALARAANAWLAERLPRRERPPLFVWMHVVEPRNWRAANPGIPVEPLDRRRYLKALEDADAALRELMRGFANVPTERAPIVVVTADHGEGLGDHGEQFHGTDLYNPQTRVPFVIAGPGIPARKIGETVSGLDLVPTILDLAGYQPPLDPTLDGRTLADLATGRRQPVNDAGTAFIAMPIDEATPKSATALVQGQWKYIERGLEQELYDLRTDPEERSNQVTIRLDVANRLRRTLASKLAAARGEPFP